VACSLPEVGDALRDADPPHLQDGRTGHEPTGVPRS